MSADQIASEALRLPEKERASLASRLLQSLPPVAFDDDEGVAEALRRDAELDADPTQAMTLRDLDRHTKPT
jgi:putative addiction module component (TIGR02574 family)